MKTIQVEIERSHDRSDRYRVEIEEGMTVLDVMEHIFTLHDPTLAYRYSCRTGLCATCNVMINGKPGLSCTILATPGENGVLSLAPLPRGETVKDLVKDM